MDGIEATADNPDMDTTSQLEIEILRLPARDRERLALVAWESLAADVAWISDPEVDPEGLALADTRDTDIESGTTEAISHDEFVRRRGNSKE